MERNKNLLWSIILFNDSGGDWFTVLPFVTWSKYCGSFSISSEWNPNLSWGFLRSRLQSPFSYPKCSLDPSLIKSLSQSPLPLAIIPAQLWLAFTSCTMSPSRLATATCMCWVLISSDPWLWYLRLFLSYIHPPAFLMSDDELRLNFNFILTTLLPVVFAGKQLRNGFEARR